MDEISIRKQRIINGAIAVLKENPIEDATMRKIAAEAGLTTGAIYHHYKDKDELFFDVINQSLHFTNRLATAVRSEKKLQDGEEVLSEIVAQVAKRISKVDQQRLHVLLLSDAIARNGEVKAKYRDNYEEILNNVADLFENAFGIENSGYKNSVASILVAAMDGIAMQQSLGVLPEDLEKTIKVFTSFFVESIPLFLENHMD